MHPEIRAAVERLGIRGGLPSLEQASDFATDLIADASTRLQGQIDPAIPVDVLVFGSVARQEVSEKSDLDYLVVSHALLTTNQHMQVRNAIADLRQSLVLEDPGDTGLFGGIASASDLVERIGLEGDTNLSHSRRALTLMESVSIFAPNRRDELVRAMLDRYLADHPGTKHGVPRFLLNDLLRYWRTLTVDYQAKKLGKLDQGWGLRYLKLIISRKLMFAGTLASLFLCREASIDYFASEFDKPPLARLAHLSALGLGDEADDALRTCLEIGDDFVRQLGDKDLRDAAKSVASRMDLDGNGPLSALQEQARDLQRCLELLFFDTELRAVSRKYLSF